MVRWFLWLTLLICFLPLALAVNTDTQVLEFAVNSSGSTNAIGDYSGGLHIFKVTPPTGETWIISRLMVHIEDGNGFQTTSYGAIVGGLTNGVVVRQNISGTLTNLTIEPIKTNGQWGKYNYDVDLSDFTTGNEVLNSRWTFSKGGAYIKLEEGDSLQILLNDDLTNLVAHTFLFHGYIQETNEGMSNAPIIVGLLLTGILAAGIVLIVREGIAQKTVGILISIFSLVLGFRFAALHYEGASNAAIGNSLNTWFQISTITLVFALTMAGITVMFMAFASWRDKRGRDEKLREEML